MKKIFHILVLIRWQNIVLTVFSCFVYLTLINNLSFDKSTSLLIVIICCSLASGNIINDIYDLDIDKINKPNRPIASGIISKRMAIFLYFILILLTVFFSFSFSLQIICIILINNLLLLLYSKSLKSLALIGNIVVSYLSASIFLVLALYINEYKVSLFFIVTSFFISLIRELIKDIEDVDGDKKYHLKTFPILFGVEKSLILFHILTSIFIITLVYLLYYFKLNHYIQFFFVALIFIPLVKMNFLSRDYANNNLVFGKN